MNSPVSPTDLRNLRKAQAFAQDALREIERAERAGVDVSTLRAYHQQIVEQSSSLLREYDKVGMDHT